MSDSFPVVEKTIAQLRHALERGEVTCVELVKSYLRRIQTYDHSGITLNSVVVMNPTLLDDAAESDHRRAAGVCAKAAKASLVRCDARRQEPVSIVLATSLSGGNC
ncbi:MAG: hypothetical protein ACKO2Q_06355, partial [Actinomycetota bacterium]